MVSIDKAVLARYKSKKNFEVLVDADKARELREGKDIDIREVLAVEEIFENASRGEKASNDDLMSVFSTSDKLKVAEMIIKKGEIQLTTEQRRRMEEEKRRRVIDEIVKTTINPQTGTPHTPLRIENAMREAKVHIDPLKSIDELVEETIKSIKSIIPIKVEEEKIAIKIPAAYTGKVHEIYRRYEVLKDEWLNDGSFVGIVRVPAGIKYNLFSFLNKLTNGEAETRTIK